MHQNCCWRKTIVENIVHTQTLLWIALQRKFQNLSVSDSETTLFQFHSDIFHFFISSFQNYIHKVLVRIPIFMLQQKKLVNLQNRNFQICVNWAPSIMLFERKLIRLILIIICQNEGQFGRQRKGKILIFFDNIYGKVWIFILQDLYGSHRTGMLHSHMNR